MNIPELPIQLVAVTETVKNGVNPQQVSELSQILVAEGSNLSDQLSAHFVTSEVNQKKSNFYNSFFREVCDKKAEIEKAFSLDEHLSGRLDDSGEGTLERPARGRGSHPAPPPRLDSYQLGLQLYPRVTNILLPDAAFMIGPLEESSAWSLPREKLDLLLLLRNDGESVTNSQANTFTQFNANIN